MAPSSSSARALENLGVRRRWWPTTSTAPAPSQAASMRSQPGRSTAIGFSVRTALTPAPAAASVSSGCKGGQVQMETTSGRSRCRSSSKAA